MFNSKKLFILLCVITLAVLFTGCASKTSLTSPGEKIKVVASIYPVYEFTKVVGGDKIDVRLLVPQGAEPHDWEPTAAEIIKIKSAQIFFYHGAGMENLDKILNPATLGTTQAIAVSQNIQALTPSQEENKAENEGEIHASHEHSDAHMWLDPINAEQEVLTIAEALAAKDPANADYYRKNAENYNKELASLDTEYREALSSIPRRDLITSHAAFGYLTKRYNLTQLSIMGLTPDSEPTPEKMANVVTFCREHQVKYIFFETLVSPKLSETVARETGAKLLVLNPIESLTEEETTQGKTYLSIMRENLANIKKALSE
ncbi:MAG: ABC-type metal ion transporter, periplasmic subunit [Firmicutes bacterium]|nr:ABC-type metal ion transporter, periplasmic subunit [Bacillota bacterium]